MKEMNATGSPETKKLELKRTFWQQRVTRIYIWILVLFLGCHTPGAIVVYILQFCTKCNSEIIHIMRDIAFYLITVNSCMNPFVYAFKTKHYRYAVRELWKRSTIKLKRNNETRVL